MRWGMLIVLSLVVGKSFQEAHVTGKCVALGVVVALALGLGACKKTPEGSQQSGGSTETGGSGGGGAQVSALDGEARDAALAEVQKHFVKGPDGWTTAMVTGVSIAPDRYLRQFRELTVENVEAAELGESDKMNGTQWAGQVTFKQAPCREAGDPGLMLEGLVGLSANRRRGAWSPWVDFQPAAVRVHKLNGKWQVNPDTMLLRGTPPGPADYANAGVK